MARRCGRVAVGDASRSFEVKAALFDSGASSSNYISKNCVLKNQLEQYLVKVNKSVKVADGTLCNIDSKVTLTITFWNRAGESTAAELDFHVLDGLSMEIVIGLPSICKNFRDLFVEMIEDSTLLNIQPSLLTQDKVQLHWESPVCQEEIMIPEPSSFQNILFLEQS